MTDPILYLSMFLGLGGVYVLVSSFDDDDDSDDDDGERYSYNFQYINLAEWLFNFKTTSIGENSRFSNFLRFIN